MQFNVLITGHDQPLIMNGLVDLAILVKGDAGSGFRSCCSTLTVSLCVVAASSALCHFSNPLMKVQPVHTASHQTKLKAKRLSGP